MNVWLDDIREAPKGWIRCVRPDEVIELLESREVEEISLDYDLGLVDERGIDRPLGAPSGRMGPFEMRDLLRRLENGTDLDKNAPALSFREIGCLPNLAAIIANEFVQIV